MLRISNSLMKDSICLSWIHRYTKSLSNHFDYTFSLHSVPLKLNLNNEKGDIANKVSGLAWIGRGFLMRLLG